MDGASKQGIQKWQIGLAVALVLVLVGGVIYFLASNPVRAQVVRDLFIIFIALEVLIVGALLSILIWQIYRLIRMLREEIVPVLRSTQEAANTVKGTASFVGEHVVSPVAKASGYLVGLREAASVLTQRRPGGVTSKEGRR